MRIDERASGDVIILDLRGRLTLGLGDERLRDAVTLLLQDGHRKLVVNLGEVPYVDSTGLGVLVRTYTAATRVGGRLKLLHPTPRIRALLEATRLTTVFETFESEPEAVGSFTES